MNRNSLGFFKKLEKFIFVPLFIIDRLLAKRFYKKIDPYFGLPEELRSITIEQYELLREKILEFRVAALNNQNAELILTANDINSLYAYFYSEHFQLPDNNCFFTTIYCYEIQENEIIQKLVDSYVYFYHQKYFYTKTALKFILDNGVIQESQRVFMIFNEDAFTSRYLPVIPSLSSGLINFILRSQHHGFLPDHVMIEYIADKITVEEIIKKLKSIEIEDNKLILIV